jgi:peptidyl-tRNA hydrolase, PTH1 family
MNHEVPREELLIVGLGNPESDYDDTRHNLGFACVRELGKRLGIQVDRKRWQSLVGHSAGKGIWLVLPQTYMNLSGQPVAKAVRDLSLTPDRVWVVHDELDLPLCRLRIRRGGSGAGHNGVLSVMTSLGTEDFVRFRVGIGKPPRKGSRAGRTHVLGRFTKAEAARIPNIVDGVASALELAIEADLERAMEQFNRPGALGCKELTRGGALGSGSAGPTASRGGGPPSE